MATSPSEPVDGFEALGFTAFDLEGNLHRPVKKNAGKERRPCSQGGRIYRSAAHARQYSGCSDIRAVYVSMKETPGD